MLHHNNDLFDLIKGEENPVQIFGETFIENIEIKNKLIEIEKEARSRFIKMFLGTNKDITIELLEQTIQKMWNEGWNPQKGNIRLFSTDFGAILTSMIIDKKGGQLVFRSDINLIDLSIWWKEKKIEIFPFHKIYKRLSSNEGDDLKYFYQQIEKILGNNK